MMKHIDEAQRCLLCKKPFCSLKGCPVHTPVPDCIRLYREGRLEEAGRILFENNPLSAVTSQVCDWRQFCYGHCVLNVKGVPVRWYLMEQEISEAYLFSCELSRNESNGRKVAVVGAGPAGIAAAIWLYREGADIDIYDANPRMGGVLRYGIPPFRLDKKYCDAYERILDVPGIRFFASTEVGKDVSLSELAHSHDAVFIAAGAEKPAALRIPGEEKPNVVEALHYLKNPAGYALEGKKVIVIGGGNVAMDACRTAARNGADVRVFYRKTFENMPANPLEVEEARHDGVQFRVFLAPVEVRDGSVVFRDCENVTDPVTGKIATRIIDGTDQEVPCDILMPAISEKPDFGLLGGTAWKPNQWRWPETDENGRLSFEDDTPANVFIAGDFLLGPKTVVEAVESARLAVAGIRALLMPSPQ